MGVIAPLWHTTTFQASYIIYGNDLAPRFGKPRYEVLRILSRTDQDGKGASASLASKKPESELVRRTLGEIGQRRMSVEADPGWRIVAGASVAAIHHPLSKAKAMGSCFIRRRRQEGKGEQCGAGNDWAAS